MVAAGAEAAAVAGVAAPASLFLSSEQAARLSMAAVKRTAEVTRVRITARTVIDTENKIKREYFTSKRLGRNSILPSL
ncbi:hypothetical protein Are01nite_82780 [Actinoplanes regularis]|nr:hypothetical protein Are01nite_82780 [Actinoplanes regularis]